jgi:hypothetical protein
MAERWTDPLPGYPLDWLLEPEEPGVRYLALRDLLDRSKDDPELIGAREEAHRWGPIATILKAMDPEGFWVEPGPGYNPKYRSTVWSVITLAQLGASVDEDERIPRACTYLMDHALTPLGHFTASGSPSGTADCLQGNLIWAVVELGFVDPRLEEAAEWMARSVTGEGIAPSEDSGADLRYYASGKCGPGFACAANNKLPCAWGAVKVMGAFGALPADRRSSLIQPAVKVGVDFLLGTDPAEAGYPAGYSDKPSGNWWKFGFPVFYVTDLLQNVQALADLGFGRDPRLGNALQVIRMKADEQGRWPMEYSYTGKTWADFGPKKQPNKWVTVRALRALKAAS